LRLEETFAFHVLLHTRKRAGGDKKRDNGSRHVGVFVASFAIRNEDSATSVALQCTIRP